MQSFCGLIRVNSEPKQKAFLEAQHFSNFQSHSRRSCGHACACLPANDQQFHLGGVFADSPPDVDGEDGRAGVEDGRQGGHQCSHHHRDHDSSKT